MAEKQAGSDAESNKLSELFSDAVAGAPSASFDVDDVAAASARVTARRRRQMAGASTLGVVIIAVGVVTVVSMYGQTGGGGQNIAAEQATSSPPPTVHKMRPFEAGPGEESGAQVGPGSTVVPHNLPDGPSKQGDGSAGNTGPRAGAPRPGCVKADRELATALAGELPAASHQAASRAQLPCPEGARGVAFKVRDGDRSGTVSVVLAPDELPTAVQSAAPGVTLSDPIPTKNGMDLLVASKPGPSSAQAPLESKVDEIARGVAGRI